MNYPIFLKYPNEQTFIKIVSDALLEEIKHMGNVRNIIVLEAKTFPDKIYIQDLIQYVLEGKLIEISEEEFEVERKGL